jgi:hypothetical protein
VQFKENLKPVWHRIRVIRQQKCGELAADVLGERFDLVFIDGDSRLHSGEGRLQSDIEARAWFPLVLACR